MFKEIIMSIRPQHLFDILTGKKKLELRKSLPKNFVGRVNLYCTKSKPFLRAEYNYIGFSHYSLNDDEYGKAEAFDYDVLNGKVVASFWFDNFTEVRWLGAPNWKYPVNDVMLNHLQLKYDDVLNYGKGKDLYAWHIKKLKVFRQLLELKHFKVRPTYYDQKIMGKRFSDLTKPPQSWQYVWVEK